MIDNGSRGAASLGVISFADYANQHTGGWRTNKRMPAPDSSSNVQAAIAVRTGRNVRTAVLPICRSTTYRRERLLRRGFKVDSVP